MTKSTGHGGDIYSFEEQFSERPLDFSANINPLGIPAAAQKAYHEALDLCGSYPDPYCRALVPAIAGYEKIPEENILCGNGAADIIFRLAYGLRPKHAMVLAPTFSEYETALTCAGCKVSYHRLDKKNNFHIEENILDALTPDLDMLFICNPNNPTGAPAKRELLLKIAERCEANETFLIIDECFIDFMEREEQYTLKPYLPEYPHLIILKAFTKIFAMPGLRLGYCMSAEKDVLARIFSAGQPWSVSIPAQETARAALLDSEYLIKTRDVIRRERKFLTESLTEMGLLVFPSQANYLLFYCRENKELDKKMREHRILIRSCENYEGLSKGYFRIAVRDRANNICLLEAMKNALGC